MKAVFGSVHRDGPPSPRTRSRGFAWLTAMLVTAAFVLMPLGTPAYAVWSGDPGSPGTPGPNARIVVLGRGVGETISGALPQTPIVQDPRSPYPPAPPTEYEPLTTFAGITNTTVPPDGLAGQMYCVNIRLPIQGGLGYQQETWAETVPNSGYVAYILHNYYPAVPDAPADLSASQQAAAVQAAIWFFTDGYVLGSDQAGIRAAAAAIVADAQANGPLVEPPAPVVGISPPEAASPSGTPAGPFTVTLENAVEANVSVPEGFRLYGDAAGTTELPNPATLPSGSQVWVGGTGAAPESVVLTARTAVRALGGVVFSYDGGTPDVAEAQNLVVPQTVFLLDTAEATAEFVAAGDLVVSKSFLGEAAGHQGAGQLLVDCGPGGQFTVDVAAGSVQTQEFTFPDIPPGSTCVITEPFAGSTSEVEVASDAPQEVTVPAEGASALITNTVTYRPGSLNVTKMITGTGAGLQGDISINVACADVLNEMILLPAGTPAGEYVQAFTGLPAGTECIVAEIATGAVPGVQVTGGDPVTVAIQPGAAVEVVLANEISRAHAPAPSPPLTPAAPAPEGTSLPDTGAGGSLALLGAGGAAAAVGVLLLIPGLSRSRRTQQQAQD